MRYRLINWKAFVTASVILTLLATLSYAPGVGAAGHSVTNITLNPRTPHFLVHNQRVTVSFSYSTTQPGGVHIYARPFTKGSATPGSAAGGAPLSATGSGTGSQYFIIRTGSATVDQVRIQMWNAGQTVLLFEAFLPVHYSIYRPNQRKP